MGEVVWQAYHDGWPADIMQIRIGGPCLKPLDQHALVLEMERFILALELSLTGQDRRQSSVLLFYRFSAILQSMKTTLTMTGRGVITLPTKLRKALGLSADDQLIAETTPEGLLLRPAVTLPIELYSDERLREFDAAEAELAVVLKQKSH